MGDTADLQRKLGALMNKQHGRCWFCKAPFVRGKGARSATIDHKIPRWLGGGSAWSNVVAACKGCNSRKGGMTHIVFAMCRGDRKLHNKITRLNAVESNKALGRDHPWFRKPTRPQRGAHHNISPYLWYLIQPYCPTSFELELWLSTPHPMLVPPRPPAELIAAGAERELIEIYKALDAGQYT